MAVLVLLGGCGPKPQPEQKTTSVIPGVSQEYLTQGVKHLQEADPVGAIKSFDEAIRNNPLDTRAYVVLGETYLRLNQFNRAIDTLTAATQVNPDKPELYYLLAMSHALAGNLPEAKENAQKSVILFQRNQDQESMIKALALLKGLMDATGETPAAK